MNLLDLPSDILKYLLTTVTPSSYFILLVTSRYFCLIKRTFKPNEIILDSFGQNSYRVFEFLNPIFNYSKYLICSTAVTYGNLELLKWSREHGCDWNKDYCLNVSKNHPHVYQWINSLSSITSF